MDNDASDREFSGYRVLVADDCLVETEVLANLVRTLGARCDTVPDGDAALKRLQASRPGEYNLVLTDVYMPGRDGFQVASEFRASNRPDALTLPFVGVSADNDPELFERAVNSGMNGMMNKPVSRRALEAYFTLVLKESSANLAFAARLQTRFDELRRVNRDLADSIEARKTRVRNRQRNFFRRYWPALLVGALGGVCLLFSAVRLVRAAGRTGAFDAWLSQPVYPVMMGAALLMLASFVMLLTRMRIAHREKAMLEIVMKERDAAIAAERAKTYFFAAVSHDIRTPLNSIIGFSELLKMGKVEEAERNRYLDGIISSGHQLIALVNDLLDLAKLESGKTEFAREPVDLGALADEVALSLLPQAQAAGITLDVDKAVSEKLPLLDRARFRQVLVNVIGNAVKFTREGGVRVTVSVDSDRRRVAVKVTDTGPGISPQNLGKLMKPFVQLSGIDRTKGTGLGLAISKQIVERMGGRLDVDSEVVRGSTFSILIDDAEFADPVTTAAKDASAPPPALLAGLKVLLVDDMPLNLTVISQLLKRIGVTDTKCVGSGKAALAELAAARYDVVLTDLWMPDMSGEELVKVIRADAKLGAVQVYAVTAEVGILKSCRDSGFDGHLLKPVTAKSLEDLVERIALTRSGAAKPA